MVRVGVVEERPRGGVLLQRADDAIVVRIGGLRPPQPVDRRVLVGELAQRRARVDRRVPVAGRPQVGGRPRVVRIWLALDIDQRRAALGALDSLREVVICLQPPPLACCVDGVKARQLALLDRRRGFAELVAAAGRGARRRCSAAA